MLSLFMEMSEYLSDTMKLKVMVRLHFPRDNISIRNVTNITFLEKYLDNIH